MKRCQAMGDRCEMHKKAMGEDVGGVEITSSFYTLVLFELIEVSILTTVTVDFKGMQEMILKEMVNLGIVKTKSEALRLALMNFALTSGLLSREKILEEIHDRAKSISISENEVQRLIDSAKEKS